MSDTNSTSNNSTDLDTQPDPRDSTTSGFLTALYIGAAVGLVLILVFSYLRTRVPDVYQLRALLNTWKSHVNFNGSRVGVIEPQPTDSFFGWIRPVFVTSEDEVIKKIGLDAAMFLRFIRTSFMICAILSIFGLVFLMPTYGTGSVYKTDNAIKDLRRITLSNVPPRNGRFWVTVIAEFFTAAVVVIFLAKDFQHYANLRRKYRVSENPSNYAIVVYDIPEDCRNEDAIQQRFERIVPGQVANIIVIRNPSEALKLQNKLDTAVAKREAAEKIRSIKNEDPLFRPGTCGALMCWQNKVDAQQYWAEEQDRLADAIHDQGSTAEPTPSAIILLSNKRAATLLVQANSRTSATKWHVERAPEPKALHWGAFQVPGYQAEIRSMIIAAGVFIFTLFWTIPATFIAGIASIQYLTTLEPFKWAKPILDWNPYLIGLIEGLLPPLVMSILISLIPVLFRFVIGFERISSRALIEMKTRDYFYMFTIYGTFFVILIGSSFFRDLNELRKNYVLIIDYLAKAIPGTSLYFATFILVRSLIPFPLMLSGVIRVIVRCIMLRLAKTERQKRAARSGGSLFPYFQQYGFGLLILFFSLAFSSLAPLVPLTALLYFGLAYICFRYVILYTSYCEWDGGGELFPGTFWGTMFGLILKQLVVIAVLSLKKAAAPAAVCAIPLIITMCLTFILAKRYDRISSHGSLLDLFEDSSGSGGKKGDELPSRYKLVYEQPAGRMKQYENLNGVNDPKDVYPDVEFDDNDQMDAIQSETFDDNVGYVPDPAADREEV